LVDEIIRTANGLLRLRPQTSPFRTMQFLMNAKRSRPSPYSDYLTGARHVVVHSPPISISWLSTGPDSQKRVSGPGSARPKQLWLNGREVSHVPKSEGHGAPVCWLLRSRPSKAWPGHPFSCTTDACEQTGSRVSGSTNLLLRGQCGMDLRAG
jgi:hypothetical protein